MKINTFADAAKTNPTCSELACPELACTELGRSVEGAEPISNPVRKKMKKFQKILAKAILAVIIINVVKSFCPFLL